MDALLDFPARRGLEVVGVLFSGELLRPAVALRVAVVDQPGSLRFAPRGRPFTLSNRHRRLPSARGQFLRRAGPPRLCSTPASRARRRTPAPRLLPTRAAPLRRGTQRFPPPC